MYSFSPKDSDAFGTLEKIAMIVMKGLHLIIGDPGYGIENVEFKECSVDSLLQKTEPQPTITKYRGMKESGAFYELDALETARGTHGWVSNLRNESQGGR